MGRETALRHLIWMLLAVSLLARRRIGHSSSSSEVGAAAVVGHFGEAEIDDEIVAAQEKRKDNWQQRRRKTSEGNSIQQRRLQDTEAQRPRRTQWLLRDRINQIVVQNPPNDTSASEDKEKPPNLLFIVSDQLRYDAVRYMQELLPDYADKLKINTPNLDKLAAMGVTFTDAYCVSPR